MSFINGHDEADDTKTKGYDYGGTLGFVGMTRKPSKISARKTGLERKLAAKTTKMKGGVCSNMKDIVIRRSAQCWK